MSDLICQIVTRKIYAYVAEIYGSPTFWDGKWCLMVYVLWRNNGCPILAYVGSSARVRSFKGNGQYRPKYKSESDLMMRDDDYAEKLARGEFGKHIDEATETDREYWRRVYAGQVMSILVDVVVREGRHVVKSGIGIADAVAEDSLKYADALLAKLDKKK